MSALRLNVEISRPERVLRLRAACDRFPLAILGPSGAGKTTVLECVAGLVRPTSGHLTWRNRTFFDTERAVDLAPEKRRIGYVMQDGVLFPHLSVRDNVLFPTKHQHPERKARQAVDALLGELGVLHLVDRKPYSLSGGERARVALARALAGRPELVLLDEAFTGLDPVTRDKTQRLLMRTLAARSLPAVLVTHDRNDALQYALSTWVLLDGRVAQEGAPDDVVRRPASLEVAGFVGVDNLLAGETLAATAGACRVRCGDFEILGAGDMPAGTPVFVCVRPEDVLLTHGHASSSARNRVPVRVVGLRSQGDWQRVALIAGAGSSALRLEAQVTRDALQELDIDVGRELVAQFKASAAHLLLRAQAQQQIGST